MKLLFVYDMRVWENREYYYTTSITQEVIDRYRMLSDDLTWCTCVIPNDDREFCRKFNPIRKDSVRMISLHKINTLFGLIRYGSENGRILRKAVRESDYVIIRLPSMTGGRAAALAKRYGKPYMVELVSCTWDALWNHSVRGKLLAPWSWVRTRMCVKQAPMVLYVTERFLQKRYPCKGFTASCSDVSLPPAEENILKKRLDHIQKRNCQKTPLKAGTLAAVNVRYKGQKDVIKAVAKLKKKGIQMEYELAGSGDPSRLRTTARRLGVEQQIRFLGAIPHDKVFSWLDTVDIYIQPSRQEGLPRAVVEAMSRGCPVTGARTGGIPELVEKSWLFSAGNVGEICRILERAAGIERRKIPFFRKTGEKDSFLSNPDCLSRQAVRSVQVASRYEKARLEQIRMEFYKKFAEQKGQ